MIETWKTIPGHSFYEASDTGRIRSVDRFVEQTKDGTVYKRFMCGRVLRLQRGSNGRYLICAVTNDRGVRRSRSVHVLVALAFIGHRPSEIHQVAHNDGNSHRNVPSNLRWALPVHNAADKVVHGTLLEGENHPSTRISIEVVRKIRRLRAEGISAKKIGERFGVAAMTAWRIGAQRRRAASV